MAPPVSPGDVVSYKNTFIAVASDCPVTRGVVPTARGGHKTVPVIQHELLSAHPYCYSQEDLIFEVFVRHKQIASDVLAREAGALREELFRKPHPCTRASPLPKQYGWGVHYDDQGRIAIYPIESDTYHTKSG